MNRRVFIKSVIALAIAKVSAAQASGSRFSLPIAAEDPLPNANSPSSSVQKYDTDGHAIFRVIGIGGAGCNAIDHSLKDSLNNPTNERGLS